MVSISASILVGSVDSDLIFWTCHYFWYMTLYIYIRYKNSILIENQRLLPVRIVAHPNKFRIIPIGFIIKRDNIQNLVLTNIACEKNHK